MRRTPFEEMDRLFDQMSRAMWHGAHAGHDEVHSRQDVGLRTERTDDGYVVIADLPGFETEEIDLRFDDGVLTIHAAHEVDDETGARSRRVHEELTLSDAVSFEEIEAEYRNGVLEILLPVEENADDGGYRIDID